MLTPTLTAPVDCRLALRLVAPRVPSTLLLVETRSRTYKR